MDVGNQPPPGSDKIILNSCHRARNQHNKPVRVNALLQILSQICIEINGISAFHALFAQSMCCKVIIAKICVKESRLVHFSLGFHERSAE